MPPSKPHTRSRQKRSSLEVDFNGTTRTVPLSRSSSSGSEDDQQCGLKGTPSPTVAGASNGSNGSAAQQHKRHKHHHHSADDDRRITPQEWGNMALLVLLYAMQGIPLGLTMGAM